MKLNIMYKLLTVMMISILISSCSAFKNPFRKDTVTLTSFCEMDLTKRIEIERMSFKLPKVISNLKPCKSGKVMHDLTRDHKEFFTRLLSFENNVYSSLGSIELRVKGDLDLIGQKIETPDEWLSRYKIRWENSYRDDYPKTRDVKRIKLEGLDCLRIYITSNFQEYYRGVKLPVKPELLGYDIEYVCWDPSAKNYPPFTISAGVGYEKGMTTFPYDMDKDILLPVFNSLKLKKLSIKDMEKRLEVHRNIQEKTCESIRDSVNNAKRKNEYQLVSDVLLKKMHECGYETEMLRAWWCRETIEDSKRDETKSQYRGYPKSKIENLKNCQK